MAGQNQNQIWVCGWGCSCSRVAQSMSDIFSDTTFRYEIFPTMPAVAVRLRFSNRYGGFPAHIGGVTVGRSVGIPGAVDCATVVPITFGGADSAIIPPGGELVSDAVDYIVEPGIVFAVSLYIGGISPYMTGHTVSGHYIKKFLARGNHLTAAEFPPELAGDAASYVYLNSIDFLTRSDADAAAPGAAAPGAVVAFGDSITAMPWPDCLARILHENGVNNRSVIRRGISGGRVLRDYVYRARMNYGEAGVRRFERDVICAGVRAVLVLHGINDICQPGRNPHSPISEMPSARDLIEDGYKKYAEIAHRNGIKIYISTIMPAGPRCTGDGGTREKIRLEVNEWIKSAAANEIDRYLDFDAALRDPNDPSKLAPVYDSGDRLHPSLAGSQRIAEEVIDKLPIVDGKWDL